jgi:hypothetical protein
VFFFANCTVTTINSIFQKEFCRNKSLKHIKNTFPKFLKQIKATEGVDTNEFKINLIKVLNKMQEFYPTNKDIEVLINVTQTQL